MFPWLAEQQADELILLGDLTDAKDRHGAKLVNRLYREITNLERRYRVVIIKGNHDYYDPAHPFFEFLGDTSDITFITEPRLLKLSIGSVYCVPAGAKWDFKIPKADYLFTHATFSGAKAENGATLTGVDPGVLDGFSGKVLSGDIHVPQKLARGKIEYVGAPYHIRFGDDFDPRVLLVGDDGRTKDLKFPAPRKRVFVITKPEDLIDEYAARDDHVRVRCLLSRGHYDKWPGYKEEIRRIAADRGWRLVGPELTALEPARKPEGDGGDSPPVVSPEALIAAYASRQKVGASFVEAARTILEEVK